jgi:hypothetical protein
MPKPAVINRGVSALLYRFALSHNLVRVVTLTPEFAEMTSKIHLLGAALGVALVLGTAPAQAKEVCGWYAIAFCSSDRTSAEDFGNDGWGEIIDTDDYDGLRGGLFCAVSGPQPRWSALRDRDNARKNGVSDTTYIKRACTDDSNLSE